MQYHFHTRNLLCLAVFLAVPTTAVRADGWQANANYATTYNTGALIPSDDPDGRGYSWGSSSNNAISWSSADGAVAYVEVTVRRGFSWTGPGMPVQTAIHFRCSGSGTNTSSAFAASQADKLNAVTNSHYEDTTGGNYSFTDFNLGDSNTAGGTYTGEITIFTYSDDATGTSSTTAIIVL